MPFTPYRWKGRIVSKKQYERKLALQQFGIYRRKGVEHSEKSSEYNLNDANNSESTLNDTNNSDESRDKSDIAVKSECKLDITNNSDSDLKVMSTSERKRRTITKSDAEIIKNFDSSQLNAKNIRIIVTKKTRTMSEIDRQKRVQKSVKNLRKCYQGRRIINLKYLSEQMWCRACKECLSLQHLENEIRRGLGTTWLIRCHKCKLINEVKTDPQQSSTDKRTTHYDINCDMVKGFLQAGLEFTHLRKIMACMNIPGMDYKTFKKYREAMEQETDADLAEDDDNKAHENSETSMDTTQIDGIIKNPGTADVKEEKMEGIDDTMPTAEEKHPEVEKNTLETTLTTQSSTVSREKILDLETSDQNQENMESVDKTAPNEEIKKIPEAMDQGQEKMEASESIGSAEEPKDPGIKTTSQEIWDIIGVTPTKELNNHQAVDENQMIEEKTLETAAPISPIEAREETKNTTKVNESQEIWDIIGITPTQESKTVETIDENDKEMQSIIEVAPTDEINQPEPIIQAEEIWNIIGVEPPEAIKNQSVTNSVENMEDVESTQIDEANNTEAVNQTLLT